MISQVELSKKEIFVIPLQPLKALLPIEVIELGI